MVISVTDRWYIWRSMLSAIDTGTLDVATKDYKWRMSDNSWAVLLTAVDNYKNGKITKYAKSGMLWTDDLLRSFGACDRRLVQSPVSLLS
jgi:hypothetical protein